MKKIITLFFLAIALPAIASVPREISFQGVLTDNSGQLVNGPHVLKLNLYDALSGGNLIYSDIESVTLTNGVFNVMLGNEIVMPDSLKFDRPYYLGVSIDNGAELSPRSLLTPSPIALYSLRAASADSAGVASPAGVASGDLSGAYPAPVVSAIQSNPVSAAAPSVGQTLVWNGSQWAPSSGNTVAFSVLSLNTQSLPHDVFTQLTFTDTNDSHCFDDGQVFSLATNSFTAPLDGTYYFDAFVSIDTRSNPPSDFYLAFAVNGLPAVYRRYYTMVNGFTQMDYTLPLKLHSGDRVSVECEPGTTNTETVGSNAYGVVQFSGFKIN